MTLLVLGVALSFVILLLRAAARRSAEKAGLSRRSEVPPRTARQRLGTFKLLVAALLVWLVISFNLRHSLLQIDGVDQPPSQWERLVRFVADLF